MKVKYQLPIVFFVFVFMVRIVYAQENNSPANEFLSKSVWPIGHTNTGQTNATNISGPTGPTKRLTAEEIQYQDMGQFQLGQVISGKYTDGKRAIWCNGSSFVAKLDYDNYNIISLLRITDAVENTGYHEDLIAYMDSDAKMNDKIKKALKSGFIGGMSSVYMMMNHENNFVAAIPRGVRVYGDVIKGNISSGIKIVYEYQLPETIQGQVCGMNMTYDGRIIVVTDEGFVISISEDFKDIKSIEMKHRNDKMSKKNKTVKFVRNSIAIDKNGGIYVASVNHMHKIIWDGSDLTNDESKGAWTSAYPNKLGLGSGSTPALMGFGEGNDQFVVITDGDNVMNMTLFWRNEIPNDWSGIEGLPSIRIAASYPVNFGNEDAKYIQQEQGVTIDNYGCIVVNNVSINVPGKIKLISKAKPKAMWAFMGYMNGFEQFAPHGIEKLIWDSKTRKMTVAWINQEVSDPTCVPFVALGNNMFYTIGSRANEFTFEGINSETGESVFHYIIGGARYNGFYSAPTLDDEGRILYGGTWGLVRLTPK